MMRSGRFEYFPLLPCEIRLCIWSQVLANETPSRFTIEKHGHRLTGFRPDCLSYHRRYYPFHSRPNPNGPFVFLESVFYRSSPLLATDREARGEAQVYYPVKIELVDMNKKSRKWPNEGYEGYWKFLEYVPRHLNQLVVGCLYLTPAHDSLFCEFQTRQRCWGRQVRFGQIRDSDCLLLYSDWVAPRMTFSRICCRAGHLVYVPPSPFPPNFSRLREALGKIPREPENHSRVVMDARTAFTGRLDKYLELLGEIPPFEPPRAQSHGPRKPRQDSGFH